MRKRIPYIQKTNLGYFISLIIGICLLVSSNLYSQVSLLPYSSVASTVSTCDDCYENVSLLSVFPDGINFGGNTYTEIFIGSNGYVTFGHSNNSYNPTGIAGYTRGPIISGQFDDLDANKGGTIYYDVSTTAGDEYVVATFFQIAPFSSPAYGSGTVSFQLVLRKPSSYDPTHLDFQIEVRYNNIGWWQSGNINSPPTAGWSTGDQTSYAEMPYSGSTSFGSNATSSNVGTNGLYQWDVTGGIVLAAPTVNATTSATSITGNSATSGGTISSDGGSAITVSGIVWSTSAFPTTISHPGGNLTTDGIVTTGTFSSNLTGLSQGTDYHVRAYATNNEGTGYGPEIIVTTLSNSPPNVTNESYIVYTNTSRTISAPGVLANDNDPEGDEISVSNTGTRATALGGSVTINSNGSFSYTAPLNQVDVTDSFTYNVYDGSVNATGTCTIQLRNAVYNGTNTNTTTGNWNGGYIPPANTDVVFQTGVVTISSSMSVRNLIIYNAASFICTDGATITVNGSIGNETRMGINTNSPIILRSGIKINN